LAVSLKSVKASALTAIRGGRMLFRELSFRVEAGRVLSVEGANGAGKTSLLRLIAGFLAPADGTISLQTNDALVVEGEERGKYIAWLGHHDAVKPQMSVREILQFYAALYGSGGAIDSALDAAGLTRLSDLPGQYLSAGQKKRVSLARLLVCKRPLWLMDEPLASLDTAGKKIAAGLVKAHCAAGGIAVVATHETLGIDCERLVL